MMLACQVIHDHWHAVERDLLSLGFRASDIGTPKLTLWELISIVVAAPTGTAVRDARSGGWTQTDELLANLAEQQAGLLQLKGRYKRNGVAAEDVQTRSVQKYADGSTPYEGIQLQAMTVEELTSRRAQYFAKHKGA